MLKTPKISRPTCSVRLSLKRCSLENFAKFTGKHLCLSLFRPATLFKSNSQVFFCELCKNFEHNYFFKYLQAAASERLLNASERLLCNNIPPYPCRKRYGRTLFLKSYFINVFFLVLECCLQLKAFLNRSNTSSNMTKMQYWMKC